MLAWLAGSCLCLRPKASAHAHARAPVKPVRPDANLGERTVRPQEGHAPRGLEKYRVERASAGDEEGERRGEDAPSPPSDVVSASSPETAAEAKAKATQLKANGARPSVSASLAESNASCDPDAGGDEAVSSGAPAPQPDTEEATPAPREDETPAGDGSGRPSSRAPNTTRKFHTTSFVKGSQTPFDVRLERALSGRGAGA